MSTSTDDVVERPKQVPMTDCLRESILDSIMNRVPYPNYKTRVVQRVRGEAHDALPDICKQMIHEGLEEYLNRSVVTVPGAGDYWDVEVYSERDGFEISEELRASLERQSNQWAAQCHEVSDIRAQVGQLLEDSGTVENALRSLPAFADTIQRHADIQHPQIGLETDGQQDSDMLVKRLRSLGWGS